MKVEKKFKFLVFLGVLVALYLLIIIYIFTRTSYAAPTGSMQPTLNSGDILFLSPASGNLTGKIISFRVWGMNVCHRVVEDHGDYLVTKGDNNPEPDPWHVTRENVLGEVSFHIPGLLFFGLFWVYSMVVAVATSKLLG